MTPSDISRAYLKFALDAETAAIGAGVEPPQDTEARWTAATGLPAPFARNSGTPPASGPARIPSPKDAQTLKANPTPARRNQFDQVYGAGAAARLLGGGG